MQERPAINRVQPDYIDKMDFIPVEYGQLTTTGTTPELLSPQLLAREPVYYTQTTLIAKPTTSGFTGLTSYNENDKIRWEVTESYLIARQAWEYISGAPTGPNGIGGQQQVGDVVAAYAITSHFDIRRDYNTTTGEELNVIDENATDRPWYQRRYMRIDWSRNLIAGYNTVLSEAEWQGQLQSEPVATFINNPEDPNAPTFDYQTAQDGTRLLNYFDFVNEVVLHPETASISDPGGNYPAIPACYLTDPYDCAPAQVTFRVAFRRMDPTRDYEPIPVSNPIFSGTADPTTGQLIPDPGVAIPEHLDMERFGFFDQSREGYDSNHRTILDTQRIHWASRHNLWVHHHYISFGADTGTLCNGDADCTTAGQFCHIGNTNRDPTHRGACAPTTLQHLPANSLVGPSNGGPPGISGTDIACQSDDDCRQTYTGGGVSRSSTCDQQTHTCGEIYYRCQSDADCQPLDVNSTCDLAIARVRSDNRGLCLMPFRQRQVRPIAYHESTGYPDYMQPVTTQIVHEWNDAFHQSVGAARVHECEIANHIDPATTDPAANTCLTDEVRGWDTAHGGDGIFPYVGCHSPVWGEAAGPGQHTHDEVTAANQAGWDLVAACGAQGTNARIGDLRYNMIGAITDHDQQGYWGLANIASDPETGEMVAGRGAVWQTITDYYATWLVNLVQLLEGYQTTDNFINGHYLLDSANQLGLGPNGPNGIGAHTVSSEVLDQPIRSQAGLESTVRGALQGIQRLMPSNAGWFATFGGTLMGSQTDRSPSGSAMANAEQHVLQSRVLGDNVNTAFQRMMSLRSSSIEGAMMNQDQASLAPTAQRDVNATSGTTWDLASPLRAQNAAFRRLRNQMDQIRSGWECAMDADFSDDLLLGLAQRLATGAPIMCSNPDDASVCFGGAPAQPAVAQTQLQAAVPATPATPGVWNFQTGDATNPVNWSLMQTYAAQFIHHGVLAHELGHSLGQRHNFTASADAINYNDNYWRVRGQGHPTGIRPRYEYLANANHNEGSYYSQAEIDGRVDEWSYSSVMDYKGLNEDAHGIGRYDYAFIANGYVGMVQAFKTVANVTAALNYGANVQGNGLSSPLDLSAIGTQGTGPIRGFHYSQIPTIYGTNTDGTPNIGDSNRFNIFLRETVVANVPNFGAPNFSNQTTAMGDTNPYSSTATSHLLVPYRFDSDERAGLVWQDQRYDAGPDIYESLHYVQERWLDYYFANSYARYRTGFSPQKYVTRMWSRYLDQMRQTTQIASYDIMNYQDFFGNLAGWTTYLNDPNAFGAYQNGVATAMTADTLVAQITMPEIGLHNLVTQPDGQRIEQLNTTTNQGTVTIPVNFGRAVTSTWNNAEAGFWWYEQFSRAGSYYDKVMSLEAFTDPELDLLGRTTSGDLRQYELNFYTMFPDQTLRFFGGLLSEDTQDFAPLVTTAVDPMTGTNTIQRTHLATLNLPANGRTINAANQPLDPEDQFTIELYSAVEAIAQIPATYDQTFMSYARLWLDGSVGAITVSDADSVQFQDPWTHENYRALHFDTSTPTSPGAGVGASSLSHPALAGAQAQEAGIAARMLLHAQDLDWQRQFGTAQGTVSAMTVRANAEAAEHKYIELLVIMRNLTTQFGSGQYVLPSDHDI